MTDIINIKTDYFKDPEKLDRFIKTTNKEVQKNVKEVKKEATKAVDQAIKELKKEIGNLKENSSEIQSAKLLKAEFESLKAKLKKTGSDKTLITQSAHEILAKIGTAADSNVSLSETLGDKVYLLKNRIQKFESNHQKIKNLTLLIKKEWEHAKTPTAQNFTDKRYKNLEKLLLSSDLEKTVESQTATEEWEKIVQDYHETENFVDRQDVPDYIKLETLKKIGNIDVKIETLKKEVFELKENDFKKGKWKEALYALLQEKNGVFFKACSKSDLINQLENKTKELRKSYDEVQHEMPKEWIAINKKIEFLEFWFSTEKRVSPTLETLKNHQKFIKTIEDLIKNL